MHSPVDQLLPAPKTVRPAAGTCRLATVPREEALVDGLGPEAYRLQVLPDRVVLEAATPRGLFYAGRTLAQMELLSGRSWPCMTIEDAPDLPVRGYMLDISRCKVPRMEQLFRLVDLLALLKFNQLQLYTEHTFAYAGHEAVWRDASPMTPAEVRELDTYCAGRCIELVPNQNAFGHMERWLRHAAYHPLAESPDGFLHPFAGWKPHGSVLYPSGESVRFVDSLLGQLLPCFRSGWVHLGCDEPWELGQGRSHERVDREGRHAVFREYVCQLHQLAARHGRRMLFWSDEVRADPARIRDFPPDIIPVAWGYEAEHDFAPECAVFAAAGYDFLVAPGDSAWNSFTGRLDTATRNISRAARAAREHGAQGMLLTCWGDNGHQQQWPAHLPAMLFFAAAAWNHDTPADLPLAGPLDHLVFRDAGGELGRLWSELARLDTLVQPKLFPLNSSFAFDALYAARARIPKALRPYGNECLFPAITQLEDFEKRLHRAAPACPDADWLLEETRLALEMTRTGLRRAQEVAKGQDTGPAFAGWEQCLKRFRAAWLRRNREGGLAESMALLTGLKPPGHLA